MFHSHQHGGQLRSASETYGIALHDWLDLSTGISPYVYPLPAVPERCWQRLPEQGDELEQAAAAYYGSEYLLAVSGSQEAIQRLPRIYQASRVGIVSPAYHSHYQAWKAAGHQVVELPSSTVGEALAMIDILIVVNPANPSAERISVERLLNWHRHLEKNQGSLIVDEAFMDVTPDQSLIQKLPKKGLLVLRSIGKFFGLAGIRLGFVWADPETLQALGALQDDWSVSHPARWAGSLALADTAWQQAQRQRLVQSAKRLYQLLNHYYPCNPQWAELFCYCALPGAVKEHQRLAGCGIFSRLFTQPEALRFGLPKREDEWLKLKQALELFDAG